MVVVVVVVVYFIVVLSGADAPHVYVRVSTLCCFHSLISTQALSESADVVGGQLRSLTEIKSAISVE